MTRIGRCIHANLGDERVPNSMTTTDFSINDHFDAFAVYEYLALREKRRTGVKSDWFIRFSDLASYHESVLVNRSYMNLAAKLASVKGALALRDHGKQLSGLEFQDL